MRGKETRGRSKSAERLHGSALRVFRVAVTVLVDGLEIQREGGQERRGKTTRTVRARSQPCLRGRVQPVSASLTLFEVSKETIQTIASKLSLTANLGLSVTCDLSDGL